MNCASNPGDMTMKLPNKSLDASADSLFLNLFRAVGLDVNAAPPRQLRRWALDD